MTLQNLATSLSEKDCDTEAEWNQIDPCSLFSCEAIVIYPSLILSIPRLWVNT